MPDDSRKSGPISLLINERIGEPEEEPISAAASLASLIDLKGSVALSQFFEEIDVDFAEGEETSSQAVREKMDRSLSITRERMNTAFENAFKPRYRLPTPERAYAILDRGGVFQLTSAELARKRAPGSLRAASRTLWAPFGEFIETQQKRARFSLSELRNELTVSIMGLGMQAARLERADTALRTATHGAVEELYRRLVPSLEQDFSQELLKTLRNLPDSDKRAAFEAEFHSEGWVGEFFGRAHAMVCAITDHEEDMLRNLVNAACTLSEEERRT